MNGDDIGQKLTLISEKFLQLRLSGLEQQAQINALAKTVLAVLPGLRPAFDTHLKEERLQVATEAKDIDLQLKALRQGGLTRPSGRPQ